MKLRSVLSILAVHCMLVVWTVPAFAGGFALQEQSVRGLGQAFAGATTGFGDGSSAFFNPAAMTLQKGDLAHYGSHLIIPSSDFNNQGSSIAPALGGTALSGGSGGDGGELGYVPNIYLIKGIADDQLKLGLSVNSPFGLASDWDSDWVGRYHAVETELLTININPSVAYQINEMFSVGAGVSAMYGDAKLTNAIDFGTIGISVLGPAAAGALGLLPQAADGFVNVEGDDWGYGYNIGGLMTLGDTRVGLHFRSRVKLELEGDADFTVPAAAVPLTSTGSFVDTGAVANADLPETLQFDVDHQINDRWLVEAGALWTRWTRLPEIRVNFDSVQDDSVTPLGWDNTWRFAVGSQYRATDTVMVRGGLSWEKTPIKNGDFRTPRIPDNDRWWVTVGTSMMVFENVTLDLSYAHLFVKDAGSSNVNSTGAVLIGDYDLSVDILSAALTWKG